MKEIRLNKYISNIDIKRTLAMVFFLLSPLWAAFIISFESHTSLLKYDAYNTSWNDEPNYYIVIREIREFVYPQNVRSYNEVESEKLGYGVYRPTTYIPYVFASFFTGTTSHNYVVYCNLLLITLANIYYICLVHPKTYSIWGLSVLMSIFLPYNRYIWSGMTETSHCAMSIIMIASGIYLFNENEKRKVTENLVLFVSVFMPIFWGTIRGYQFVFILIPLVYLVTKKRGMYRLVSVGFLVISLIGGIYLYFSVLKKYDAPYFISENKKESIFKIFRNCIQTGDFRTIFGETLQRNIDAVQWLISQFQKQKWHWVAVICPLIICISFIIGMSINAEIRKHKTLLITYFFIVVIIFEAFVMMGRTSYIYGYALGIWACGYYLLCCIGNIKTWKSLLFVNGIALILFMAISVYGYGTKWAFPQKDYETIYNDEELKAEFSLLLPRDTSSPWNNTIASSGESMSYLRYLFPSHIANSTCKPGVLEELINTDSVKSKYISLADKNKKLIELCDAKYELIYHDYGLRLYKVR